MSSTLEIISQGEGTTDAQARANGIASGYDVTLGYNAYGNLTRPVSTMTMAELDTYQTSMLNDSSNNWNSSAAGKYQITRTTRRSLMTRLGISDEAVYTPELQDRMANELLKDAGITQYNAGSLTLPAYQNNVANIWASMPDTSGRGVYIGQSAHVSQTQLQSALALDKFNATHSPVYNSAGQMVVDAGGKLVPGATFPNASNASKYSTGTYTPPTDALQRLASEGHHPGYQLSEDDGKTKGGPDFEGETKIESVFTAPWNPRPNVFQQFSTMTYSVSLYLMGPGQYKEMMENGEKNVKGLTLFAQSAGINDTGMGIGNHGAKRSKYFSNDFYIDNIQFRSLISGTSALATHNTFELKFTITEPAGITFFDRLTGMVKEEYPNQANYASHPYLMVVRFYGYDENGNQISGHNLPEVTEKLSDIKSIGEKFIPFMFTGISFRLHEDKIDYSCEAVCPQSHISNDLAHSTLYSMARLQGSNLAEILGSRESQERGLSLVSLLNAWQKALVADGTYEQEDTFKISFLEDTTTKRFLDPEKIKVLGSGASYLKATGMQSITKEDKIRGGFDQRFSMGMAHTDNKMFHFNAGTKIIKVIDLIMQTSSYITDQLPSKIDQTTGQIENNSDKELTKEDINWFKIRTVAIPKKDAWDNKRNDFAYDIEFVITPYYFTAEAEYVKRINDNCFSIHKEYNYWFTGENTEVLGFYQDFKYLYYGVTTGQKESKEREKDRIITNARTPQKYMYQVSTDGSYISSNGSADDMAASIASELYSPGDMASAEIEIVGDPDFIAQSELFYSPRNKNIMGKFWDQAFLPDGSVNYDASEIYFTINYNTIVDYDLETGLADTTSHNLGRNLVDGKPGVSRYAFVYRANEVTTQLSAGKFIQKLKGTMKPIPPMCNFALKLDTVGTRREDSGKKTASGISSTFNNGTNTGASPTAYKQNTISDNVMRFSESDNKDN